MIHRIVIAESNPLQREGMLSVLARIPELCIAGVCQRMSELEEQLRRDPADLLLLDGSLLSSQASDRRQSKAALHIRFPLVKTILIHRDASPAVVRKCLQDGVCGYLLRSVPEAELIESIRTVLGGGIHIQEAVRQEVLQVSLGLKKAICERLALTSREVEVLRLIAEEHTTEEIAGKLFISLYTVESHRKNIIAKLGVRNTAGLVREAFRMQLLS
jgi:DNA-binding NarL/FixJ family response regulator